MRNRNSFNKNKNQKFKSGSASFYTVIITCLLFGVIIISFGYLVTREQTKNIENNLSQSAYDAALAGVEDAKLALSEYFTCLNTGEPKTPHGLDCDQIKNYVEISTDPGTLTGDERETAICDPVANILQRAIDANGNVLVQETNSSSGNAIEAYTCVSLNNTPSDYRGTISTDSPVHIIPLYQTEEEKREDIRFVTISWYSSTNAESITDDTGNVSTSYLATSGSGTTFTPISNPDKPAPTPPPLTVSLFQTADQFMLSPTANTLDDTNSEKTNRGTVWLVPNETSGTLNSISASEFAATNNHSDKKSNQPYTIKCEEGAEFYCTATIELPAPIGGMTERSEATFFLTLSLPYETPDTDFSVIAKDSSGNEIKFRNAQVVVDSTGRANDIYSRVEARIEYRDLYFPFIEYAMDLSGDSPSGGNSLSKKLWATKNCWIVVGGEPQSGDGSICEENSRAQNSHAL